MLSKPINNRLAQQSVDDELEIKVAGAQSRHVGAPPRSRGAALENLRFCLLALVAWLLGRHPGPLATRRGLGFHQRRVEARRRCRCRDERRRTRRGVVLQRLRSFDGPTGDRLPGSPRPLNRRAVNVLLVLFEQREARVIFRHYPREGYCNRLQRQKRDQFPLAPRDQARGYPFLSRRDGDLVGVLSLNAIPEARSPGCAPRSAFPCVASEKPRRFFLFSPTPGQASRGHIMPLPMSPEARQPWSLAPTGLSRAAPALQGCARTIAQWIIFLWRGLSRPG